MAEVREEGKINGVPYSIPRGYRVVSEAQANLGSAAIGLLGDLDRSPNGRHQGDSEFQDPTGVSQGNPLLKPGTHIGFDISGRRIVVPEQDLQDARSWIEAKSDG